MRNKNSILRRLKLEFKGFTGCVLLKKKKKSIKNKAHYYHVSFSKWRSLSSYHVTVIYFVYVIRRYYHDGNNVCIRNKQKKKNLLHNAACTDKNDIVGLNHSGGLNVIPMYINIYDCLFRFIDPIYIYTCHYSYTTTFYSVDSCDLE